MRFTPAFAAAFGLLAATSASAQSDIDPVDDILACRSIEDALQRVACFDTAATALDAARRTGDVVTVNAATIEAVERDTFGFSMPSLPQLRLGRMFGSGDGAPRPAAPDPLSTDASSDAAAASENSRIVSRNDDGGVEEIVLRVARTETFGYGKVRFITENGQVWSQTDSRSVRIPRGSDGFNIFIRRAALDSFLLRVENRGVAIRVRRSR